MTPADERTAALARRALEAVAPTLAEIAGALGVSYDALRSWSIGRSSPRPENLKALAALLRQRSALLASVAGELDGA